MVKGNVKWFSNPKGYGFILMDDGSEVFVHHSLIVGEGYKTLKEGEEVTFELIETEKGKQAHKVTRLPGVADEIPAQVHETASAQN